MYVVRRLGVAVVVTGILSLTSSPCQLKEREMKSRISFFLFSLSEVDLLKGRETQS